MNEDTYEQRFFVTFEREARTDRLIAETWRNLKGELERDGDLPAEIRYEPSSGKPLTRLWYRAGERHRLTGPAFEIILWPSDIVMCQAWYQNGKLHREGDLPAEIGRSPETGRVISHTYAERGLISREKGPAVVKFHYQTGRIRQVQYWQNGCRILKAQLGNAPSPC